MAYETGYRSTLAAKLNATDVTITVATAPTVTAGRMHLKNGSTHAWIKYTGVTGTTLTGVTFVSQTADPATTVTGVTFPASTSIELVGMHDQLVDKVQPTYLNQIATTYATTAARDSALGADGAAVYAYTDIYVTATGLYYNYNLSSATWESIETGTTTPNASTTAAGKVELPTSAELLAGTGTGGTGAALVPTPATILGINTFVAGEAISQGEAITTETIYPYSLCDSQLNFGNVAATQYQAFRMVGNGIAMTTLNITLKKVLAPVDNLTVDIYADSSGPTGASLSSGTVAGGSLTTSLANVAVTMTNYTPTDLTPYWVVLSRSTALDAANYYQVGVSTDDTVAFPYRTNNTGVWGSATLTESPSMYGTGFYSVLAIKTKATTAKRCIVKTFAQAAVSQYALVSVSPFNRYGGQTSLSNGNEYYLSDTAGAISQTAGTIKAHAGFADTSTSIKILNTSVVDTRTASTGSDLTTSVYSSAYFAERPGYCILSASGTSGINAGATIYVQTSVDKGVNWTDSAQSSSGSGASWTCSAININIQGGVWVRGKMATTTATGTATFNFYK